ncbi:MAG: hypothetical protein AAF235_05410, partial [Planctomycetota bacterium]
MQALLDAIPSAASHPLALVAYVTVVGAWVFVIVRHGRLRTLTKMLDKLPEHERAALVQRELSVQPRAGLSAADWLAQRKRDQLLVGFVVSCIAVVLLASLIVFRSVAPTQADGADAGVTDFIRGAAEGLSGGFAGAGGPPTAGDGTPPFWSTLAGPDPEVAELSFTA